MSKVEKAVKLIQEDYGKFVSYFVHETKTVDVDTSGGLGRTYEKEDRNTGLVERIDCFGLFSGNLSEQEARRVAQSVAERFAITGHKARIIRQVVSVETEDVTNTTKRESGLYAYGVWIQGN